MAPSCGNRVHRRHIGVTTKNDAATLAHNIIRIRAPGHARRSSTVFSVRSKENDNWASIAPGDGEPQMMEPELPIRVAGHMRKPILLCFIEHNLSRITLL